MRTREGLDTGTQLWLCQALFWLGRCRVGGWGLRPRVQVAWLGAKGVESLSAQKWLNMEGGEEIESRTPAGKSPLRNSIFLHSLVAQE